MRRFGSYYNVIYRIRLAPIFVNPKGNFSVFVINIVFIFWRFVKISFWHMLFPGKGILHMAAFFMPKGLW